MPRWLEIFFELSFIIGNIVTLAFWALYYMDPTNVRAKELIGRVNPITDAWVHGGDTLVFWLDLLFVTRHHI